MSTAPQTRLGPYELIERIGEGGMGEVWKALDTRLNRVVAIKRLKSEHARRFEQEARAIAALNHPNICTLFDIGPDYLVMEYIEGKPLGGPLRPDEAIRFALQIAGALEAAHAKGILHRDLKPANVLISGRNAKLLDFGLAKLTADKASDATTQEGAVMGTAAYMSPEQARGQALDQRSDVFSFGVVLYEMVSGRRAFNGPTILDTLHAIVHAEPENFQSPASSIVKRCLEKDPARRYQTAAELREALEKLTAAPLTDNQPSIAVLPFANMSRDPDDEFFSDGLAEEILNILAHIPGLKVTARTSAFAFRGKEQDIRGIAEALNVRSILEGSVRRAGRRIRVTAQLINAADGYHLWSERYDREMTDVFAVQDEIAAAIAAALKVSLTGAPKPKPRERNFAAYTAFLEGRHHWLQFTPSSMNKSLECYRRAIAADPEYAMAHGGIAEYYIGMAMLSLANPAEALPLARPEVERALELDPDLAEAHTWKAHIDLFLNFDWAGSERSFRRAIELTRNAGGFTRFPYALWILVSKARWPDAHDEFNRVLEGDPLHLNTHFGMSMALDCQGKPDEAAAVAERALRIGPSNNLLLRHLAYLRARQHRFDEAFGIVDRLLQIHGRWGQNLATAGMVYAIAGRVDEARQVVAELTVTDSFDFAPAERLMAIHSLLGDLDGAFEWSEKAIEQRQPYLCWVGVHPAFHPLRADPRYAQLLGKLNLR